MLRKDGSRVSILIGAAAFDEGRAEGISFALTDRKRAEEALRNSETHQTYLVRLGDALARNRSLQSVTSPSIFHSIIPRRSAS
jgi:hypothetical protein